MTEQTPKLKLNIPAEESVDWAGEMNANWDALDLVVIMAASEPGVNDVAPGQVKAYLDDAASKVKFYTRYQDGTLKKGEVSLAASPTPTPTPTPTATPTPTVSGPTPTPTPPGVYMDPDGDDYVEMWRSTGDTNYQCVDDGVRQPGTPGGDYVIKDYDSSPGADVYSLSDPPSGASDVKVWVYGTTGIHTVIKVDFYVDGEWQGEQQVIGSGQTGVWGSHVYSGEWTEEQLAEAKVKVIGPDMGSECWVKIYEVYVEVL
jgi:hypothetical protein